MLATAVYCLHYKSHCLAELTKVFLGDIPFTLYCFILPWVCEYRLKCLIHDSIKCKMEAVREKVENCVKLVAQIEYLLCNNVVSA